VGFHIYNLSEGRFIAWFEKIFLEKQKGTAQGRSFFSAWYD